MRTAAAAPVMVLPRDVRGRTAYHDEAHVHPVLPVAVPSLVTQVTLLVERDDEPETDAHLVRLAQRLGVPLARGGGGRTLVLPGGTLIWEHNGEHDVLTVIQPIDLADLAGRLPEAPAAAPDLLRMLPLPSDWLAGLPGRTLSALQVVLLADAWTPDGPPPPAAALLLGGDRLLGSRVRDGAARILTTSALLPDGTLRFLVLCAPGRLDHAGRVASSLLDVERYRMLAMLGYPDARSLLGELDALETELGALAHDIEARERDDRDVLDELTALAARVELLIAADAGRFAASLAYDGIVQRRIEDLRGTAVPTCMGVFSSMRRRLPAAMATIASVNGRLDGLSARVARTSDLIRTRVDVETQSRNQELLAELRGGQSSQIGLQEAVEGLSIFAIAYYTVGLIDHVAAGLHMDVEVVSAEAVPVVLSLLLAFQLKRRFLRGRRSTAGDG